MITERDEQIINHALKYGLTVRQCTKLFFPLKYGHVEAQRRLKALYDRGILPRYNIWETHEYVYGKECSRHQIYRMDFYSELYRIAEIIEFEPEYSICDIRPDALIRFAIGKYEKVIFLEVDLNNKTRPKKYEDLYTFHKDEVRKNLGVFPEIVIMSSGKFNYKGQLKMSHVDLHLSCIKNILII